MTAYKGSSLLLKVGNGGAPETFTTIGGMRVTALAYNNAIVDASNRGTGAWRTLLEDAGLRSLNVSGSGIFTDAVSEETVRAIAMSGQIRNFQMSFGNGDSLTGAFQITAYQRAGNHNGEETYSLSLASAGTIVFTHV